MTGRYSPWAERFKGVGGGAPQRHVLLTDNDGTTHSGIAIQYPSKHPKFYCDPTPIFDPHDKPRTGAEYHRFFQSVHLQGRLFSKGQTTKLASLNRYLYASNQFGIYSGGHRSADDPNEFFEAFGLRRFSVNQDAWYDFLQKHRWYDLHSISGGPFKDGLSNGPWSVDNPPIWQNLLGSLELTDRLIRALIEDHHSGFEAMLFGRIVPWDSVKYMPVRSPFEGASVLLTQEMEYKIAAMSQSPPEKSPIHDLSGKRRIVAMEDRLENILRRHTWSFSPTVNALGFTTKAQARYNHTTLTALNTTTIKFLVTEDITLAERFMLQFEIAALMIHEIMHAIITHRYHEEGLDCKHPEPFMDFDPIAEMGEAMERRIFGGRYNPVPLSCVPLASVLYNWPRNSTGGQKNPHDPIWQTDIPSTAKPFPPLFISKLFSAEFWDNPYLPKKSDKRFWSCDLFKNWQLDKTQEKYWDRFESAIAGYWQNSVYEEFMYRKGWFTESLRHWICSPWGSNWDFLAIFVAGFQSRDEIACCQAADRARLAMPWENRDNFFASMPHPSEIRKNWIYFAIRLLMYAAMPVRETEYSVPSITRLQDARYVTFKPGMDCEAERKHNKWWNVPEKIESVNYGIHDAADHKREANVLYNPFELDPLDAGSAVVRPDPSVTQMKYLALVHKMLIYIKEEGATVSKPWYLEIERCTRDLESQRQELIAERSATPTSHLTLWAKNWPFKSPEYDPFDSTLAKWDRVRREWQPVDSTCPDELPRDKFW
ncbi:hypothetical protein F5B22DRAFT_644300 [Xylaria bambusicola]|uniref:uncharacterized protein n=1 Tax=Xylaria bambusicola TaxID=326684 RepID=UPI002007A086|nr:uncharacterized protein F5B22DRAFT_644300 [Xylaria bambusicola]KAI0521059.1 hypothetical protein F5B22DRAFT_644300 [Xylaria bambusicola]